MLAPIEKLDVKNNVKNDVKKDVKNGVKNDSASRILLQSRVVPSTLLSRVSKIS